MTTTGGRGGRRPEEGKDENAARGLCGSVSRPRLSVQWKTVDRIRPATASSGLAPPRVAATTEGLRAVVSGPGSLRLLTRHRTALVERPQRRIKKKKIKREERMRGAKLDTRSLLTNEGRQRRGELLPSDCFFNKSQESSRFVC